MQEREVCFVRWRGGGCVCISGVSGGESLFKLMSFYWRGGEAPSNKQPDTSREELPERPEL